MGKDPLTQKVIGCAIEEHETIRDKNRTSD